LNEEIALAGKNLPLPFADILFVVLPRPLNRNRQLIEEELNLNIIKFCLKELNKNEKNVGISSNLVVLDNCCLTKTMM
jgi:hypothetical protein